MAKRPGVGKERWSLVNQSRVDGGQRAGATSEEVAEIETWRMRTIGCAKDVETLRGRRLFVAAELDPQAWATSTPNGAGPGGRVDPSVPV